MKNRRMTNRRKRRAALAVALGVAAVFAAVVVAGRLGNDDEANRQRAERCRAWFATFPDPPRDFLQAAFAPAHFDPDNLFPWPEPAELDTTPPEWASSLALYPGFELGGMEWPGGFSLVCGKRKTSHYSLTAFNRVEFPVRPESRWNREQVLEKFRRMESVADPERPVSIELHTLFASWTPAERDMTKKIDNYLMHLIHGIPRFASNDSWHVRWSYGAHGIPLYGENGKALFSEHLGLVYFHSIRITDSAEPPPADTVTLFDPVAADLEPIVAQVLDAGGLPSDVEEALRHWLNPMVISPPFGYAREHRARGLYYVNDWEYLALSGDDSFVEGRARLGWIVDFHSSPAMDRFASATVYLSPDATAIVGVERPEAMRPAVTWNGDPAAPESP